MNEGFKAFLYLYHRMHEEEAKKADADTEMKKRIYEKVMNEIEKQKEKTV